MSGGIAYVLDETGEFAKFRCNKASVDLEQVFDPADQHVLQTTIYRHFDATGSPRAKRILENWNAMLPKFVKVFPHEFKRVMKKAAQHETITRRVAAGQLVPPAILWPALFPRLRMGKVSGFLEYAREVPERRPVDERVNDWFEIYNPFPEEKIKLQGARCMDCGVPVLPHRLPRIQHHSRLERSGLARPLARSQPRAACHQQFPGVHRPHLPGPVRSRLRARHQRARRDHQEHREDDRRPRLGRRLDRSRTASLAHRQTRRRGWLRARPALPPRSSWRAPDIP